MKPTVIFNPISYEHCSHIGAVVKGETITVKLKIKKDAIANGVHFVLYQDTKMCYKKAMQVIAEKDDYFVYSCDFTLIETCLYWFCFSFWDGNKTVFVSKNYLSQGEVMDREVCWQITVLNEEFKTPSYLKGGIMYQIFADRFNRVGEVVVPKDATYHENWNDVPEYMAVKGKILNNDFFGGNFEGVIAKLSYLKSLGVTILYFNPIFEAESNHKYDTCDFEKIDACFGGDEKFKKLLDAAKKQGFKVILDGVFNHVGENSKYFNKSGKYAEIGAYQSQKSKYYDWFCFEKFPKKYTCWWGIELLPSINENCSSYLNYVAGEGGIIEKYLKMGIDGWRLDVVDELPDEFLDKICERARAVNPDATILGEVWEDASNKVAYGKRRRYFASGQLDSVMNYPWRVAIKEFIRNKDSALLYREITDIVSNYPSEVLHSLMNILGTHDTERMMTTLGAPLRNGRTREEIASVKIDDDKVVGAKQLLKLATALQYTLPGFPSIYYGEEAGMEGYADPFNRLGYPWGKEDENLIAWHKKLKEVRENPVFTDGDIELLPYENEFIGFKRTKGKNNVVVMVNVGNKKIAVPTGYKNMLSDESISHIGENELFIGKNILLKI